ncbi:hypothetical protein RB653_006709 [Dictyostelium firmibasis]|uniref:allantoinase n=1 Tax=Dictyostelium firmibasis TaxID=79012 RepID=A0AAN7TTG1_9MYCE
MGNWKLIFSIWFLIFHSFVWADENHDNIIKIIRGKNIIYNGDIKPLSIIIRNGKTIGIKDYFYNFKKLKENYEFIYDDFKSGNKGMVIMGGLVDSHVHVNEPGRTEWEGFESATSAAAAGGVTTIVDMPLNSSPVTTNFKNLQDKIESMKGKLRVDVGLLGGIIPGNSNEIKKMVLQGGVLGFKSFLLPSGIDEFPSVNETDIQEAMNQMKSLKIEHDKSDVIMMFHAEVEDPIKEATDRLQRENADPKLYETYLESRPKIAENIAINKIIEITKLNKIVSTHIVHLSSSEAIKQIRDAMDEGVPISAETTYNYLYLNSESVPYGNTLFKSAPPVREQQNQDLLWDAMINGTIKLIVSDHSPCTIDLKQLKADNQSIGDFLKAWGGISSLELGLPIIWTQCKNRGIPIYHLSQWLSDGPSKLVGLNDRKGSIEIGRDADFVIFNPNESFIVDEKKLLLKNKFSAYNGQQLFGVVYKTILRGNTIFNKGDEKISKIIGKRLIKSNLINKRDSIIHC